MRIEDSSFGCNGNVTTTAGIHVGPSANAKNEIFKHNNISFCYYGIYQEDGSFQAVDNEFSSEGGTCNSGTGAVIRINGNRDPDIIKGNLEENSTEFLSINGGGTGPNMSSPVVIDANHFDGHCFNSKYWIETEGLSYTISNNSWDLTNLTKVFGHDAPNPSTPLIQEFGTTNWPNGLYSGPGGYQWWKRPGMYGTALSARAFVANADGFLFVNQATNTSGPFPSAYLVLRGYDSTGTTQPDDYAIQNVVNGIGTSFLVQHQKTIFAPSTSIFTFDGYYSGITSVPVPIPNTPQISNQGTPGATTYSYVVVAYYGAYHTQASKPVTTNTGSAKLDRSNFNSTAI